MTTWPSDDTDLRELLDDLIAALTSHFHAVRNRRDETDPEVQAAYTRLRAAAERYDDMLFELTGEVTPWEFPEAPPSDVEYEDRGAAPDAVTVMVRRDYGIADPAGLLLAGREAYADMYPEDPEEAAAADVSHPGRALYQLLHAYGVDGLDSRAEVAGLAPRGGTVWVQGLTPDDAATLVDDPFGVADEDLLIYRLDEVLGPPDADEEPTDG